MDRFETLTEAITEAVNRCVASIEQLANAIRQSETQCGYIKRKTSDQHTARAKGCMMVTSESRERERELENDRT